MLLVLLIVIIVLAVFGIVAILNQPPKKTMASFTPADISGLVVWFKAEDFYSIEEIHYDRVLSVGDKELVEHYLITKYIQNDCIWIDESGNDNSLVQLIIARKPRRTR